MSKKTVETDRELLEMAAKAAGLTGYRYVTSDVEHRLLTERGIRVWNPLKDDGDALRLAVKLGLEVYKGNDEAGDLAGVVYFIEGQSRPKVAMEYHKDHNDAFSATRRAITRAAAEMQLSKEDK